MSAGTGRMWRSYQLVIDGVRRRRAGVSAARIRRAEDQFALYLSGVSFWSRDYWRACRWGVRALRSRVGYQVLPHVIRRVVPTLWRKELGRRLHVAPGVRFGDWRLPDPRIPYHDIQPPT
jgi:hypothetical protein